MNARFLWKRIPADQKDGKCILCGSFLILISVAALWEVGKALWMNDYENFYSTLRSTKYPPYHQALVQILEGTPLISDTSYRLIE